jgi:hypothetical protein
MIFFTTLPGRPQGCQIFLGTKYQIGDRYTKIDKKYMVIASAPRPKDYGGRIPTDFRNLFNAMLYRYMYLLFQVALAGDDPGIFYIFDYFLIMSVVIVLFDENT